MSKNTLIIQTERDIITFIKQEKTIYVYGSFGTENQVILKSINAEQINGNTKLIYESINGPVNITGIQISSNNQEITVIVGENEMTSLFSDCDDLEYFLLPEKIKKIVLHKNTFRGSGIKEFTINQSENQFVFPECVFDGCYSLNKITLSSEITDLIIGQRAFNDCVNITEFKLPENIEYISLGKQSFRGSGLLHFDFPESIKKITDNANLLQLSEKCFENCVDLSYVNISTSVSVSISTDVFFGCTHFLGISLYGHFSEMIVKRNATLKEITILKDNIKQLESDNDALRILNGDIENQRDAMQTILDGIQSRSSFVSSQMEELQTENINYESQNIHLTSELASTQTLLNKLREEHNRVQQLYKETDNEFNTLRTRHDSLMNEHINLTELKTELIERNTELEKSNVIFSTDVKMFRDNSHEKDYKITKLQEKLIKLKEKYAGLASENNELLSANNKLVAKYELLKKNSLKK